MAGTFFAKGRTFWRDTPLPLKILAATGCALVFAGIMALVGLVFMALWNRLVPSIFGLRSIGYWEGWGLMILCSMLFKHSPSGRHFSGEARAKRRLRERMREAAAEAVASAAAEQPGGDADASGPEV